MNWFRSQPQSTRILATQSEIAFHWTLIPLKNVHRHYHADIPKPFGAQRRCVTLERRPVALEDSIRRAKPAVVRLKGLAKSVAAFFVTGKGRNCHHCASCPRRKILC